MATADPGPPPVAHPLHITGERTAALVGEGLALEAARAAFAATRGVVGPTPSRTTCRSAGAPPPWRVLGVGRTAEHAERTVEALTAQGHDVRAVDAEETSARADVIITATTAGCMGADARGEREPPPELFTRARVFCDLPEQARRLGQFRHAPSDTVLRAWPC
ncbi:hypothetical protein ACFW93_02045 [Streptomyces canus]|uniref:hypothetical protein n=1 Tax=Streptomyces canus TaxID=58343 RepID=UPI0036998591